MSILQAMQQATSLLTGSNWLSQLQPASWRDVPFHVDTIDVSAGDNVVLREYPFQDLPTVFRMGEAAEEIKFSAYVIGSDYQAKRDALRKVLTGEGVLIHPSSGAIRCWANGKFTIREAPTQEGGMARFELSFVRAEPRRYPRSKANTAATAIDAAQEMFNGAIGLFAAVWNIRGQPGWVVSRLLDRFGGGLGQIYKMLTPLLAFGGDWADDATGKWQLAQGNLESLANNPQQLADMTADLLTVPSDLQALFDTNAQPQAAWLAAFYWVFDLPLNLPKTEFKTIQQPDDAQGLAGLAMYGVGVPSLQTDSPARATQIALSNAADQFLQALGTAALVQICAAADWSDTTAALAMRSRLHTHCLALLQQSAPAPVGVISDDWYAAMLRMHSAMLADFAARSNMSQQHTSYTLQTHTPVWKLSYDLYGTPEFADEILAANPHITHPLLIPPNVPLRVVKR